MKLNTNALRHIFFAVLCCTGWGFCSTDGNTPDDWDNIWLLPMPSPTTVQVSELYDLGKDLENRQWLMVPTKDHQIHFTPSADKTKVAEIYARIDNLYTFLAQRSPAKPPTPIRVFLVPGEIGRSRCSKTSNAMRAGADGDTLFILTSLLHEETHIFNFAFLNDTPQGWWTGEFSCIYFQQRALWQVKIGDHGIDDLELIARHDKQSRGPFGRRDTRADRHRPEVRRTYPHCDRAR